MDLVNWGMPSFTAPLPDSGLTLETLASELLKAPDAKATPAVAQALLMVATTVSVDPNALVPSPHYSSQDQGPLLPFLLDRAPFGTPALPVRQWPLEVSGFTEALRAPLQKAVEAEYAKSQQEKRYHVERGSALDVEWLAALLVAGGADPWADVSETHPLGRSLARALEHNQVGLVDRLMAVPGGPSWAEVAHQRVGHETKQLRTRTTWLHAVVDRNHNEWAPLLERLLAHAGPEHEGTPHPLSMAFPWALEAYAKAGKIPTESAVVKPIVSQWRARLKSNELSAEQFSQMENRLLGQDLEAPTTSAREALFTQGLGRMPWGGTFGSSRPAPSKLGVDALLERAPVTRGALAGQWSHAAVLLVQQIRSFGGRGLGAWSLLDWAFGSFGRQQEEFEKGQLSKAIGFLWRPGVSIDGLMVLGLYGTDIRQGDSLLKGYYTELFEGNLAALGIEDGPCWAFQHRDDAVAFTKALVGRGSPAANARLAQVWAVVIERLPGLFESNPALLVELTRCLAGPDASPLQQVSMKSVKRCNETEQVPDLKAGLDGLSGLLKVLPGNWTNDRPPVFEDLPASWRCVAAEAALRMSTPAWLKALAEGVPSLDVATQERVAGWVEVRRPLLPEEDHEGERALVRIKEALLDAKVGHGPNVEERARPKIRM